MVGWEYGPLPVGAVVSVQSFLLSDGPPDYSLTTEKIWAFPGNVLSNHPHI